MILDFRHDSINSLLQTINEKTMVFTNGCFDILHAGHVRYLQSARNLGDCLIVGLNTDASVRGLKGESRPVQNEADRAEILAALRAVDHVILFDEPTPYDLICRLTPTILCKGGDYQPKDIVGSDWVLQAGGKVLSLPFVEGRSTSSILNESRK